MSTRRHVQRDPNTGKFVVKANGRNGRLNAVRAARQALDHKVDPAVKRATQDMVMRYEDALRKLSRR